MNNEKATPQGSTASSAPKKRINTHIHRRSKATAVYPLSDEWEDTSTLPPKQLRMPSTNMKKTHTDRSQETNEH